MDTETFCEDCDFVEPVSRKQQPFKWLCKQHPCYEKHGFVTRDAWTNGEPYLRCKDVNGGKCKLFKPAATPQTSMEV